MRISERLVEALPPEQLFLSGWAARKQTANMGTFTPSICFQTFDRLHKYLEKCQRGNFNGGKFGREK